MNDWILLLILALSGIIGYLIMGLIDRYLNRHTNNDDSQGQEKEADEHAESGE